MRKASHKDTQRVIKAPIRAGAHRVRASVQLVRRTNGWGYWLTTSEGWSVGGLGTGPTLPNKGLAKVAGNKRARSLGLTVAS